MPEVVELIPKKPPAKQIIKEVIARRLWVCSICNGIINRGERFIKITEKRWGLRDGQGLFWTNQPIEIRCINCHAKIMVKK